MDMSRLSRCGAKPALLCVHALHDDGRYASEFEHGDEIG